MIHLLLCAAQAN